MQQAYSLDAFLNDPFWSMKWLNPEYWFGQGTKVVDTTSPYIFRSQNFHDFKLILTMFAMFFFTIIAYCSVRLLEIRKREHDHLHHEIMEYAHHQAQKAEQKRQLSENGGSPRNERWEKVLLYLFSPNQNDWKLSIIEADSMLEDLMGTLGFKGDTLGDRLKSADRDTFPPLTTAWEVHNIRNRIAHEGLAFEMLEHEAKRVIALYEGIFHEFGYI